MYTVRADLAKDFDGTAKKVRDIGIRHVQANLTQSGKSSKDQRKLYDSMGISWESIHAGGDDLRLKLDATIAEAKSSASRTSPVPSRSIRWIVAPSWRGRAWTDGNRMPMRSTR